MFLVKHYPKSKNRLTEAIKKMFTKDMQARLRAYF